MIRLWELLFDGCWHHWRAMKTANIIDGRGTSIGTRFFYQCEKCHKVKKQDVI